MRVSEAALQRALVAGAILLAGALVVAGACSGGGPTEAPAAEPQAERPEGLPGSFPDTPGISGRIPSKVEGLEAAKTPEEARPFFDRFSWQSFIALSWPASRQGRGVPEQPGNPEAFLGAKQGAAPNVWGEYKESFELFGQGDQRPSAWDSSETPVSPCGEPKPGQRVFVMVNKVGTLLDEVDQAFSNPIIDQLKRYAYYEVRFNKAQYDFIRGADGDPSSWLYLAKNLVAAQEASPGGALQMPVDTGEPFFEDSMMLKAAWRILTPEVDQSRFYAIDGLVLNPDADPPCQPAKLGLAGFHIAQKTADFPQWIWSTFEQVDNVPGAPNAKQPYSFNNGTSDPPTPNGWANKTPKAPPLLPMDQRTPTQITRFNPIAESTQAVNAWYRRYFEANDLVWQYYQLVSTQWPTEPLKQDGSENLLTMQNGGIYPQDCGQPFPQDGVVNAVAETYVQSPRDAAGAGGNSCMQCHYTAAQSDFSWVLQLRSH